LYDYTPFGEALPLSSEQSREKYIGKETDYETSLADHGVRKYDAGIGRFTCPDVLWEKYAGWSPYHYTRNNPINRLDENGLWAAWFGHPSITSKGIEGLDISATQEN
jgi:RHS repeat-associated protein